MNRKLTNGRLDDNLSDIQGIIISGYGHLPFSQYLFLHFADGASAREWLRGITPLVTTACWKTDENGKAVKPVRALNLGFTSSGLSLLNLDPDSAGFSEEFVQGMAEQHRSRRLGDEGDNSPGNWDIGSQSKPIHALLILQAISEEDLHLFTDQQRFVSKKFGVDELAAQMGYIPIDFKEHFGFHDSISQPNIEGSPAHAKDQGASIKAGEFILGYANAYGQLPPSPTVLTNSTLLPLVTGDGLPEKSSSGRRDVGRNGSYMVFRKLYQDVASFRSYFKTKFPDPEQRVSVTSKIVGRRPNGEPLVPARDTNNQGNSTQTPPNDFGYAESDLDGLLCPVGAHIRRSNPRDSLDNNPQESLTNVSRHRIIRRGVLYGRKLPDDSTADDQIDRGILFICINADIRRQFEFVQQTWVNNPKFNGLYCDPDPIAGGYLQPAANQENNRQFTIPAIGTRERLKNIPQFVTMKGGDYFFLPSVSAIKFLASPDPG